MDQASTPNVLIHQETVTRQVPSNLPATELRNTRAYEPMFAEAHGFVMAHALPQERDSTVVAGVPQTHTVAQADVPLAIHQPKPVEDHQPTMFQIPEGHKPEVIRDPRILIHQTAGTVDNGRYEAESHPQDHAPVYRLESKESVVAVDSGPMVRPMAGLEFQPDVVPVQLDRDGPVEQWDKLARHVQEVVSRRSTGDTRLRICVKPEHLGEVELEVAMRHDQLEARFITSNEGARQLIEAGLPHLQRRLQTDGMTLRKVALEVSVNRLQVAAAADASVIGLEGGERHLGSYPQGNTQSLDMTSNGMGGFAAQTQSHGFRHDGENNSAQTWLGTVTHNGTGSGSEAQVEGVPRRSSWIRPPSSHTLDLRV